jgi:hypothetical protein
MTTNSYPEPAVCRENPPPHGTTTEYAGQQPACRSNFGRFRVLPRQRQFVAAGVPIELGTCAFDVLVVSILGLSR